ncbi:MAG: 1-phosphofructokinase family hexose kinase [Fimbriimonas sp.]
MILTVTLNPAVDHQIFVGSLKVHDTNRVVRTEIDAGGKGTNLSRVFAELGGLTTATGLLGGSAGAVVRRVLDLQGVVSDFVETAGETRTNVSVEDASGEPPTTYNAKGPMISDHEYKALLAKVDQLAPYATWICMGGSLPPGCRLTAFREIAEIGLRHGRKILLDADGDPCIHGLRALPDLIKPNSKEAARLLGRPIETTEAAIEGAEELRAMLKPESIVVISRGEDGAILAGPQGIFIGHSAPVEAKSTIGSGDSFLGGMLWALEEGQELEEAFRWGLAAGAATATTDGTEIARRGVTHLLYQHCRVEQVG